MHRAWMCLAGLSICFAGGCATLVRGTHQTLDFQTNPTAATVDIDGKSYVTPAKVDVARRHDYDVTVHKEGYRTVLFTIDPEWDGLSLVGNIILPGGSAGIVYDRMNGADRAFYQMAVIDLTPATQPTDPPMRLRNFKGHLLTDEQYAAALKADRNDRSQFFEGQP
jgi:PEGA domain